MLSFVCFILLVHGEEVAKHNRLVEINSNLRSLLRVLQEESVSDSSRNQVGCGDVPSHWIRQNNYRYDVDSANWPEECHYTEDHCYNEEDNTFSSPRGYRQTKCEGHNGVFCGNAGMNCEYFRQLAVGNPAYKFCARDYNFIIQTLQCPNYGMPVTLQYGWRTTGALLCPDKCQEVMESQGRSFCTEEIGHGYYEEKQFYSSTTAADCSSVAATLIRLCNDGNFGSWVSNPNDAETEYDIQDYPHETCDEATEPASSSVDESDGDCDPTPVSQCEGCKCGGPVTVHQGQTPASCAALTRSAGFEYFGFHRKNFECHVPREDKDDEERCVQSRQSHTNSNLKIYYAPLCPQLEIIVASSAALTSTLSEKYSATNCIDGDSRTMCVGKKTSGDTLTLTIPAGSVVTSVRITNRPNYFHRLDGAVVSVDGTPCGTVTNAGAIVETSCNYVLGTEVTITTVDMLNLMDVSILGAPQEEAYDNKGKGFYCSGHPGGILKDVYMSRQECQDACTENPDCVAYDSHYVSSKKWCVLAEQCSVVAGGSWIHADKLSAEIADSSGCRPYNEHFSFGDRRSTNIDWQTVYTYDFVDGFTVDLSGWTHTRTYARGFLANKRNTNPKAIIHGLLPNHEYSYQLYQFASSYGGTNGFTAPQADEIMTTSSSSEDPTASGTFLSDANGQALFQFRRISHHVQLSAITITDACPDDALSPEDTCYGEAYDVGNSGYVCYDSGCAKVTNGGAHGSLEATQTLCDTCGCNFLFDWNNDNSDGAGGWRACHSVQEGTGGAAIAYTCAVDCVGVWGEWGECSEDCGSGTQTRTFSITSSARGGGTCSNSEGATETQDCESTCTDPCFGEPYDVGNSGYVCYDSACAKVTNGGAHGSLEATQALCDTCGCNFLFDWNNDNPDGTGGWRACHSVQSGSGGAAIAYTCAVDCVGSWSDWDECSVDCGSGTQARTFSVSSAERGSGTCSNTDGATENRDCESECSDTCYGEAYDVGNSGYVCYDSACTKVTNGGAHGSLEATKDLCDECGCNFLFDWNNDNTDGAAGWRACHSVQDGTGGAAIANTCAVPDNIPGYTLHEGHHCGGTTIDTWSDGSNAEYGSLQGINNCAQTCDSHSDCAGFIQRDVDGICGFWKSGPLDITEFDRHHCYVKTRDTCYGEAYDVGNSGYVCYDSACAKVTNGGAHGSLEATQALCDTCGCNFLFDWNNDNTDGAAGWRACHSVQDGTGGAAIANTCEESGATIDSGSSTAGTQTCAGSEPALFEWEIDQTTNKCEYAITGYGKSATCPEGYTRIREEQECRDMVQQDSTELHWGGLLNRDNGHPNRCMIIKQRHGCPDCANGVWYTRRAYFNNANGDCHNCLSGMAAICKLL